MSSASSPMLCSQADLQPCSTLLDGSAGLADKRSRKRKHNEISSQSRHELGSVFTIEAPSNGHPAKPVKLVPKLLTSRSCLPLSYLDLGSGENGITGTQVFGARVPSLEANLQGNAFDQPLLIATASGLSGALFAIERVGIEIYVLCRLAKWVTLTALEKLYLSSQSRPRTSKQWCSQQVNHEKSEWWRSAVVAKTDGAQAKHDRKADVVESNSARLNMGLPKLPPVPAMSVEQPPAAVLPREPEAVAQAIGSTEESLHHILPDPAEALAAIRAQYQEALYLSRSSLAYFAKGPLSRARAAFSSISDPSESCLVLVEFLRSSILTLTVMDKKYKDVVPGVISSLPAGAVSEDDIETVIASLSKKSRKSRRDKMGKDGLYPGEEANIASWWLSRYAVSPDSGSGDTGEDTLNVLLSEQRARETQLQIILILETMVLEAPAPIANKGADLADDAVGNTAETQSKKKPKKPVNLTTLIDILVDRLSIWQSMSLEDSKSSANDSHTNLPLLKAPENADQLKSFCVDVLLPFYGARLPEITTMLCQKLGGPKAPSPARPPLAKTASMSRLGQKPGSAILPPPQRKPRRTLERVLTEEKTSRSRPPSLSRSATDSALPSLKREVSDTSLSTIPLNRVALQKSQRYSQREVDLNAASQAKEAKLKKKANVDRELQGAIAALKRPNPRLAVKELVEAAEKRTAGSNTRKSKNPVRSLFAQGVQVAATPKGNRQKDVFGGLPRMPATTATAAAAEPDEIPPSSISRVPSSVQRHPPPKTTNHEPKLPRPYLQTTIEQTPTRGPSKQTRNLLAPETSTGPPSVFLTPSKPRRPPNLISQPPQRPTPYVPQVVNPYLQETDHQHSEIEDTPRKPPAAEAEQNRPPESSLSNAGRVVQESTIALCFPSSPPILEEESSKSIFETLGWDDYVDELA